MFNFCKRASVKGHTGRMLPKLSSVRKARVRSGETREMVTQVLRW